MRAGKFLLLFVAFIFLVLCYLQTYGDIGDTLQEKLKHAEGVKRIDALNEIASIILNKEPQKSIVYSTEALELAIEKGEEGKKAQSLFNLAEAYRVIGENNEALNYYLQALNIYKVIEEKQGIANCADAAGRIYRLLGDYNSALDFHLKAYDIYKELNNEQGIASSLINAGVVYRNLGKKDMALKNYEGALEIGEKIKNQEVRVNALVSIGNVYWYEEKNQEALSYYEQALKIARQYDYNGDHPGGILNNIGNVYRNMGNFNKAIEYYHLSLNVSQKIGDKNLIAVILKNIGIAYKDNEQYTLAIQNLNESRNLASDIKLLRIERETLEQLSKTYALLGDYKKALDYHIEFTGIKDSIIDSDASDKISLMQLGYELKEKENQRTIREIDLELKVSRAKNVRNAIIFVGLLALALAAFLWGRCKLKLKSNRELRELNTDLEKRVEERTRRLREENEQRRIAQEQAELANEAKNKFLATISHEVRTPINAIIGFCDLTIKSNIDQEHQKNLQRVKDSSEHLLALIKDILDYSQIESGKMELKNLTFDLAKIIESVVNAFYLDAESKGIKLSHEIAGNIPRFVIGDPDALRQILYNLIGNAIKFTDKGEVDISVKLEENAGPDDKIKLCFAVEDTGIGISKLKQKLIFMDFTQVDDTSRRKYGGAGLGLTISKHFIEMMQGNIWVESDKGKGSRFLFTVHLLVDKKKSIKTVVQKPPNIKTLHILVAEDNLLNAQVVVAFLKRLGHTSRVAGNGIEAVNLLSKEDFDVVLMDIEMPEMDGIEATETIRAGKNGIRNPKIPIFALTAHALKDYEQKSFIAGMDNYLTKPVDIDRLEEVLQSV
ncbi:MAG: tetratricopeptide repeat protein [Bacteroidales bacterium]|nr:tetratricopeptide repeat protein [Bacteroidales bacterium]